MTSPLGSDIGSSVERSSVQPSVDSDDIVQACVKHLATFPAVVSLLAEFEDGEPFLFQHEMQGVVESTQRAAVVVSQLGGWASPNVHNSLAFPRLSIEVWADPLRDDENNVTDPIEVQRRALYLLKLIDTHLHRPQGGDATWGTVRTIDCQRLGEPVMYRVPDGDGGVRAQVFYGVTVG